MLSKLPSIRHRSRVETVSARPCRKPSLLSIAIPNQIFVITCSARCAENVSPGRTIACQRRQVTQPRCIEVLLWSNNHLEAEHWITGEDAQRLFITRGGNKAGHIFDA